MPLHRLTTAVVGVPDVATTAGFYRDFGLVETAPGRFATADGGEQLRLVATERRRLVELGIGVDDADDLDRAAHDIATFGLDASREGSDVLVTEPGTGLTVRLTVAARYDHTPPEPAAVNAPGRPSRVGARAAGLTRAAPVQPRKLGHVVVGSLDPDHSERFFREALGFRLSDQVAGAAAFLRCSTDHHNLLVQRAPVQFLHHTSWLVDDVDEIGRGAANVLAAHPDAHVWGLGRHFIGSNFFWYLKDPAGSFAEYHSDLDVIVDDEVWEPGVFADARALYAWGPPVPRQFLAPDDLADLMA
jgi:catechol 2,3-dioxygenase-like lactoylglutathione lyase family enzyme